MPALDTSSIYYISSKVLKESALDVFFIIFKHGPISKVDILREYKKELGVPESSSKFRYVIDEAIALLIGTTFVEFNRDATSHKFSITEHGEIAAELMEQLFIDKPEILKQSKIVSKYTESGELNE